MSTLQTQIHSTHKHVSHYGEGLDDDSDDGNDDDDNSNLTFINIYHMLGTLLSINIFLCHLLLSTTVGVGTDNILILEMGKLRHRCCN